MFQFDVTDEQLAQIKAMVEANREAWIQKMSEEFHQRMQSYMDERDKAMSILWNPPLTKQEQERRMREYAKQPLILPTS